MEKKNKYLLIIFLLLFGFIVRVGMSLFGLSGDINAFAEWGMRFWEIGARNFYNFEGWYYTFPTQPPLANLMFAGVSWLTDQNIFALLHNSLKIPPALVVEFFGRAVPNDPFRHTYEYYFFLKMIPIISDLLVSLILYEITYTITKDYKKSLFVFCFYLFNPVTIFLSGIWGQIESTVALFGIGSFVLLYYKKVSVSILLMFVCLYLKPTWAHLVPFYLFLLYSFRPKIKELIIGGAISFILFILFTYPFSGTNFIGFTIDTVTNNMLPSSKGSGKLSVSAFNFFTIFWKIDIVFTNFLSKTFSLAAYIYFNVITFMYYQKSKNKLVAMLVGVFTVAMGSYLFMDNMLERYFFPAMLPISVIVIYFAKYSKKIIVIISVLFLTLFYSYFRRISDEIGQPFSNYNYLLIRVLSITIVGLFLNFIDVVMLQFKRG